MLSTFFGLEGIFDGFKESRDYNKINRRDFNNYFYEETETLSDVYYITEEIELKEGNKIYQLYGFVASFDLAKKLVKSLNKQFNSTRFDFNKVELMKDSKINDILSGKKEGIY